MFSRLTGELQDPFAERQFLHEAWPRQRWQFLIVVGVCGLGVLSMILANLSDERVADVLPGLLAVRGLQFAFMAWGWSLALQRTRPEQLSLAIGLAEVVTVAAECANFALAFDLMKRAETPGMPFMVLLLLVFYTLIPIRFVYTIGVGIIATMGTVALYFHHYDVSLSDLTYIGAMFVFVNLLGIGYGSYINRLQRQDFISRRELEREVTQRQRAEAEALASKELAERASNEKSKFIAVAGHDLRQPLHALGLWVDNLEEKLLLGDVLDSRTLVAHVVTAKDALSDLLDRLLHVAHLEAGVTDIEIEPVAARSVLADLQRSFASQAAKRHIHLKIIDSSVVVETDALLLQRILDNLVDNAIKYGASHGRITAGVRRHGRHAVFQVWNTGDGIPPAEVSRIFDEFHQVEKEGSRSIRGLGLGLSIVRRLADLLDHSINVHSVPGQLTCFSVTAPLSLRQPAQEQVLIAPIEDVSPLHVLLIDDDTEILDAMALVLNRWGHEVTKCQSEDQVETSLERTYPDLIITDLQIGETTNGIALVTRLRAECHLSCPVILMSGDTTPQGLQQANESGFTLLSKPVKPARLRLVMNRLLKSSVAA